MRFLILIYGNATTRRLWDGFSEDERAAGFAIYAALLEDLAASGELVATQALSDTSLATRVLVREGRTITTDGPFDGIAEYLTGLFLVDCESRERAVEHAARVPEATFGLVEVRPVLHLAGLEI